MTEPTDATLQQRCAEVVEWQCTGVLPGNALRDYAAAHWAGLHDALQMAERDTSAQAMQWIAKWGTSPVSAGEPVAWFEYNEALDAWFLAYSKNPKAKTRPLVFGDAPPQPAQAQDKVPLPQFLALKFHARRDRKATITLLFNDHETADAWVRGIKGGQHGAE